MSDLYAKARKIVNIPALISDYYTLKPNIDDKTNKVAFGTSGHRGSSKLHSFNDTHIAAIAKAVAEYRKTEGVTGPLNIGADTHALSEPALRTCVEVLAAAGVEIIFAGEKKVDLKFLLEKLAEMEITSVLVEGGGTLNFAMLEAGLVDKVYAFIAPKILGGKNAPTSVGGEGFKSLDDAINFKNVSVEKIGTDILIVAD